MKKMYLSLLGVFPFFVLAQDTLFLAQNQGLIIAQIKGILPQRIVYRFWESSDTSLYSIARVDLDRVVFSDGSRLVFVQGDTGVDESKSYHQPDLNLLVQKYPIEINHRRAYVHGISIGYSRLNGILMQSSDSLVRKYQRERRIYSFAGNTMVFASIPVGVAALIFSSAYISTSTQPNYYPNQNGSDLFIYETGAITSILLFIGLQAGHIILKKVYRQKAYENSIKAHNHSLGF